MKAWDWEVEWVLDGRRTKDDVKDELFSLEQWVTAGSHDVNVLEWLLMILTQRCCLKHDLVLLGCLYILFFQIPSKETIYL